MKMPEAAALPAPGAAIWPISVEAYHVLGETGLVPKQTELLYGVVYRKMSKSPLHSALVQFLQELIQKALPAECRLRTEQPITCANSEPEPDLAIVRGTISELRQSHPRTAELVIEVCVTSADYDRSKLRAYASAHVKECWLVLAQEKQVEVYLEPAEEAFARKTVLALGSSLSSEAIPGITVDLNSLFESQL